MALDHQHYFHLQLDIYNLLYQFMSRPDFGNLSEEPNGKELLFFIGEIYVSESQSISGKPSGIFQKAMFVIDLISGYLTIKTNGSKPSLEEVK